MVSKLADGTCQLCSNLVKTRKQIVKSKGNSSSKVIFLGMNPGQNEDEQGVCFVGRSGELLNTILEKIGLTLEDIYVTNSVRCFGGVRENVEEEIRNCSQYLLEEIYDIKPQLIITLGTQAYNGAEFIKIPKPTKTKPAWGIVDTFTFFNGVISKILPIYHPSYILRNGGEDSSVFKQQINFFIINRKFIESVLNKKLSFSV